MRTAPHPFTLRQLQYASAVARTKGFRRAAEECAVSQPSLSAQVAQLERGLGVRLFERDRRRVLPVSGAAELLSRFERLLVQADDLVEAARLLSDPLAGTLRLGVIPTIAPYLLPDAAPALRKRFPRLTLAWTEEKTPVLAERLQSGELDGALLALEARLGEDLEHEVIAKDRFLLAAASRNPLARGDAPVRLEELAGTEVLLLDDGHCLRDQALAFCARAGVREREFRATSLATLVQMVAAGNAVTLLPELAAPAEKKHSAIALRPLAKPAPARTIALVWRRSSPLAPALKAVAGVVRVAYPAPRP